PVTRTPPRPGCRRSSAAREPSRSRRIAHAPAPDGEGAFDRGVGKRIEFLAVVEKREEQRMGGGTVTRRDFIKTSGAGAVATGLGANIIVPGRAHAAKTKRYYAFSPSFTPDPVNYRQDLFAQVGLPNGPRTWEEVRVKGAEIKKKTGHPVGIGLANEIDTGMAMRTIMYAFGAHEQDENGNLALNSKQTLEAIKFVRALFQEAMTAEVFTWDASSNNRAMIAGKVSVVLNAISITR